MMSLCVLCDSHFLVDIAQCFATNDGVRCMYTSCGVY